MSNRGSFDSTNSHYDSLPPGSTVSSYHTLAEDIKHVSFTKQPEEEVIGLQLSYSRQNSNSSQIRRSSMKANNESIIEDIPVSQDNTILSLSQGMSHEEREILRQTRANLIRMSQRYRRKNRENEDLSDTDDSLSTTDSAATSIPSVYGRRPSNVQIMSMDESGHWKVLSKKAMKKHRRRRRHASYSKFKKSVVCSLFNHVFSN
jgi:hypothetical protein